MSSYAERWKRYQDNRNRVALNECYRQWRKEWLDTYNAVLWRPPTVEGPGVIADVVLHWAHDLARRQANICHGELPEDPL